MDIIVEKIVYAAGKDSDEKALIEVFSIEETLAEWKHVQTVETKENAVFAVDREKNLLYATSQESCRLTVFCIGSGGTLEPLQTVPLGLSGAENLHLQKDTLWAVGGACGVVAVHNLKEDGMLDGLKGCFSLDGECGPNKERQIWVAPRQVISPECSDYVWIVDSAQDNVRAYSVDYEAKPSQLFEIKLRPAACPFKMAVSQSKKMAYIITEGVSLLVVCQYDGLGELTPLQMHLLAIEDDVSVKSCAVDICLSHDGTKLYIAIAGSDRINVYDVADDGTVKFSTGFVSGGKDLISVLPADNGVYAVHSAGEILLYRDDGKTEHAAFVPNVQSAVLLVR